MNFKKISLHMMAATVLALPLLASAHYREYEHGQGQGEHQHHRIRHALREGELNYGETAYLVRQQRAIARTQAWAEADGYVSHRERCRINRMRRQASEDIYEFSHNGHARW
jgi:uncharacterized membrane protein YebE (DUF533 family)